MPKLKVLETRQTSEEVTVMSWSPKMDLLALGNIKGVVHLHRLNWQRVWQLTLTLKDKPVVPELMTWHPEGLFLVVTSGITTFVIDVEGGKVVHNHEISFHITAAQWCSSSYQHTVNEALSSHFRQQQIQRLESNLSILFLGTSEGYVYAYTGGFLLGLCVKISEDYGSLRVLQVDANQSLQSFYFLCEDNLDEESLSKESNAEVSIVFSLFKNNMLPNMAPIIRPLGLQYILFLKGWATIQGEFASMNESWAKIVDLYTTYMTFGGTKDKEVVRVDYLELALTGISSAEMEIFLGSAGREKEAKKNINVINSAAAAIIEHIRAVKCSMINMLTELTEIGGFLQHISKCDESTSILIQIRKAISYFFLAVLNMQGLIHNFVELSLHFMNLILNTIHSFNVQDLPDFIEEDIDTDKVLAFLETNVERDLTDYLFANVNIGYNDEKAKEKEVEKKTSKNIFANIMDPEGGVNDYKDFANLVRKIVQKSSLAGPDGHPILLDYSESEVKDLIMNFIPRVNTLTKSLLCIPVLCSVPFEADTFPILRIPKENYFIDQEYLSRKPFIMYQDEASSKIYLTTVWSAKRVLLFELHSSTDGDLSLKFAILNASKDVRCVELFSSNHMTLVSYDQDDKRSGRDQDPGKTVVCQVAYPSITSRASELNLAATRSKCGAKPALPLVVLLDIPEDVVKPAASLVPNIDYVLPIESFSPRAVAVSEARKVGSILGEDKRTVVLLEMEVELTGESTLDDTGDDEDD